MTPLAEEVVAHVFDFLTSHRARNAVSLVSKSWYELERWSRKRVFVGNCHAINPERAIARFPRIKALKLKGKPSGSDLYLFSDEWGGFVHPWIEAMDLEELRLTRMVVSDESLQLLSRSFLNFKSLVLVRCEGFTTDGLAAIAANCRVLRELDLQEIEVHDLRGQWLSCFPDSFTSLVSLNFSCLKGEVNLDALERLVARSPNLKTLKLNRTVPLETLYKILLRAPQLVDLGTGSYIHDPNSEYSIKLTNVFVNCKSIRSLSGFMEFAPCCLPAIYPLCLNLTSLNLSCAPSIRGSELIKLIRHCRKLQRLWILDCIRDEGPKVVASACKELQ